MTSSTGGSRNMASPSTLSGRSWIPRLAGSDHDGERGLVSGECRALALNGAELVYRAPIHIRRTGNDYFEIQSRRARSTTTCTLSRPTWARTICFPRTTRRSIPSAGDPSSSIIGADRRPPGLWGRFDYVAGVIDIEALRHHRGSAQWDNWLKDLRTELYQTAVRGADLPEKSLPGSRADEAPGIPQRKSKYIGLDASTRHLARNM